LIQEIVIASGKGGTGKTFISSNLSYFLLKNGFNILSVDADVEAPDLLLALGGVKKKIFHEDFYGNIVDIDYSKCIGCGLCEDVCRFNAISIKNGLPRIDYNSCEGFGACMLVCPVKAISMKKIRRGNIFIAISNENIPIVTGDLDVGERNSGLLVYRLRNIARKYALEKGLNIVVIDAAPGIGCPVVSSIVGANLLIIVIEPTSQSLKGAKRLLNLSKKLGLNIVSIINKYDLNQTFSKKIEKNNELNVIGKIGYDENVVKAYSLMTPFLKLYPEDSVSKNLIKVFYKILSEVKS